MDPTNIHEPTSSTSFPSLPRIVKVSAISNLVKRVLFEGARRNTEMLRKANEKDEIPSTSRFTSISSDEEDSDYEVDTEEYTYISDDVVVPAQIRAHDPRVTEAFLKSQGHLPKEQQSFPIHTNVADRITFLVGLCMAKEKLDEPAFKFVAAEISKIDPKALDKDLGKQFKKLKDIFTKQVENESKQLLKDFKRRLEAVHGNGMILSERDLRQTADKIQDLHQMMSTTHIESKTVRKNLKDLGHRTFQELRVMTKSLIAQNEGIRQSPSYQVDNPDVHTKQTLDTVNDIIAIAKKTNLDTAPTKSYDQLLLSVNRFVLVTLSPFFTKDEFSKYLVTQSKLLEDKKMTMMRFGAFCESINNNRLTPEMQSIMQDVAKKHFLNKLLPRLKQMDTENLVFELSTLLNNKGLTDPLRKRLEVVAIRLLKASVRSDVAHAVDKAKKKNNVEHLKAVSNSVFRLKLLAENISIRDETKKILIKSVDSSVGHYITAVKPLIDKAAKKTKTKIG